MKRFIAVCVASAALALFAGQACARDIPAGGMTVEEVSAWLQSVGYKGEIKTAKDGDRYVSSAAEGVSFDVYMYNCKNGRCATLQMLAGFDLPDPGLAGGAVKINDWNSKNRFIKGYLDATGDPWAQFDVNLSPGGTYEGLDDSFKTIWVAGMPDFKKFIGW